jgi:hypothetical protein
VIRWRGRYYCVDDGIWFESRSAVGPWSVCLVRPYVVSLIPPRYPVYYMKYVYIYDVTPDFVYMGYTPGYLNAYVYGPTVVYGTGYYYRPWYGRYYYPRPYTWGFGVRYNPWYGWGFGFGFGYDWFNISIGFGNPYGWGYWGCGGWWGPRVYRPVYYGSPYHYRGGYYGYNSYNVYRQTNVTVINNYYNNTNIYRNRTGVITRYTPRTSAYERVRSSNGRSEWAANRRGFENNFERNRAQGMERPGRISNETIRERNGNLSQRPNREWRDARSNDNNERIVVRPRNGEQRPENGRIGRDWRNDNNSNSERIGVRPQNNTQRPEAGRVDREWRNNPNSNNERIIVRPNNGVQRPESNSGANPEIRNNRPESITPNREMQPNREPLRRPQVETPSRSRIGGSENSRPARSYEAPQRRVESPGGSGRGPVVQPQNRPSQPSGGYTPAPRSQRPGAGVSPAPRAERSSGSGYSPAPRPQRSNGGGQISRPPSSGGRSEGRAGSDNGRMGRRG